MNGDAKPTWDVVDEASDESFPASDPPGWGSAHASTLPVELERYDAARAGRHVVVEEQRPRYLVVYSGANRRIAAIAWDVAARLHALGRAVDLADVGERGLVHPADYDALVVGLAAGRGLDLPMARWFHVVRDDLAGLPCALFVTGPHREVDDLLLQLRRRGWKPPVTRFLRRRVSLRVTPRSLDHRDANVLAERFVSLVEGASH